MAKTFYKDTDGKAVDFTLSYTISGEKPILVNDIPGFPSESGDSGDMRSITADGGVYQWQAPAALSLSIGDTVYVDVSEVSGTHEIPDAAFTTTSGAGNVPFLRVLEEKDSNNWTSGKLINFNS